MEKLSSVRPLPIYTRCSSLIWIIIHTPSVPRVLGACSRCLPEVPQGSVSWKYAYKQPSARPTPRYPFITYHLILGHQRRCLLDETKKSIPFHKVYDVRYTPIPRSHYSYPDHVIPPKNDRHARSRPSFHLSTTFDTPDIRALIRPIRSQRVRPACVDSMTFSKIRNRPTWWSTIGHG